jgi:hypothetical protein
MSYNPPGKKRKLHAADIHHAAQVARAVSFSIHFRKGPHETYQEAAKTLDEARTIAARLTALHGQWGRMAMVYAITPEGASFPVGSRD